MNLFDLCQVLAPDVVVHLIMDGNILEFLVADYVHTTDLEWLNSLDDDSIQRVKPISNMDLIVVLK